MGAGNAAEAGRAERLTQKNRRDPGGFIVRTDYWFGGVSFGFASGLAASSGPVAKPRRTSSGSM
jgi:hypothetical protein